MRTTDLSNPNGKRTMHKGIALIVKNGSYNGSLLNAAHILKQYFYLLKIIFQNYSNFKRVLAYICFKPINSRIQIYLNSIIP